MSHSCDERYTIYDEREFRANKPHECDACDLPIRKGDRYTRVFMLYNGRKEHVKRCARCQLLHEHLRGLCEPGEQWPDERLNCGLSYESEWGQAPGWVNALAFWSPGDPLPATNPCCPTRSASVSLRCYSPWGEIGRHKCQLAQWATAVTGSGTEVCS